MNFFFIIGQASSTIPAHSTSTQANTSSFTSGQKLQQTSVLLTSSLRRSVSGQSPQEPAPGRHPSPSCPTCSEPSGLACVLWPEASALIQSQRRAFSASILAPNLHSEGSSHIPCSSETKCDDLSGTPVLALSKCLSSLPYSLRVTRFLPEALPNSPGHRIIPSRNLPCVAEFLLPGLMT